MVALLFDYHNNITFVMKLEDSMEETLFDYYNKLTFVMKLE